MLAVFCVAIYIVTSLMTPAMPAEEVAKVCWDHPLAFLKGRITGASDPRMVTLDPARGGGACYTSGCVDVLENSCPGCFGNRRPAMLAAGCSLAIVFLTSPDGYPATVKPMTSVHSSANRKLTLGCLLLTSLVAGNLRPRPRTTA